MAAAAPPTPRVQDANALPLGTRLGEFELLSLLGVGGFGIVYLAFDHALEREVAVKEYMPASLAGRTETMHVSLRSQSDAETFALGLRSFVNEARLLARFDHPSLLKVLRFWEANGTAYMAMPVMRGRTLKEQRQEQGRAPDEATLRSMLEALLGALERLHGEGVFHRDIAPDNIQIEPDGHPVLLDFGAARRVLSDKTQTLTAILKPAYAPIEQYAETGSVKQGPWTDFYALGATLHYVLLGKPPAPATARAVFDESAALAGQGLPGYSLAFLQMVDWMLAPRPADRPQHVAELRQVLLGERQVPAPFLIEPSGDAWDKTQVLPHGLTGGDDATLVIPRTMPPAAGGAAAATGPYSTQAPSEPPTQVFPRPQPTVQAPVQPPVQARTSTPEANVAPAAQPAQHAASVAAATASAAPPPPAAPAAGSKWGLLAAAAASVGVVLAFVLWPKATPAPPAVSVAAPAAATPAIASVVAAPAAVPSASSATGSVAGSTAGAATPPSISAAVPVPAVTGTISSTAALPSARAVPESEIKPAVPVGVRAGAKPGGATPALANKAATGSGAGAAPAAGGAETPAAGYGTAPAGTAATSPGYPSATPATPPGAHNAQANRPQAAEPATPPAAAAASPESKCAGRNALSYFVCMERECLRGSFAGHADCQAWRKDAKRE